jgi:hypothetical protein
MGREIPFATGITTLEQTSVRFFEERFSIFTRVLTAPKQFPDGN